MKKLVLSAIVAIVGFTVATAQTTGKTATAAKPENKYGTVSKDATIQKPATTNNASDIKNRPVPVRKAGKPISRPATVKAKARTDAKVLQAAPAPRPAADAYDKGRGKKKHTRVAKTSKGCAFSHR